MNKTLSLVLLFLMTGTVMAQHPASSQTPHASVTITHFERSAGVSWQRSLDDHSGIPTESVDPIHRHNAHAFVYVLEGSIIMQVKGGKMR